MNRDALLGNAVKAAVVALVLTQAVDEARDLRRRTHASASIWHSGLHRQHQRRIRQAEVCYLLARLPGSKR